MTDKYLAPFSLEDASKSILEAVKTLTGTTPPEKTHNELLADAIAHYIKKGVIIQLDTEQYAVNLKHPMIEQFSNHPMIELLSKVLDKSEDE